MMPAAALQVFDALGCRQDEHHREDGQSSEACERERHIIIVFAGTKVPFLLDKVRLNLFKSTTGLNIFP